MSDAVRAVPEIDEVVDFLDADELADESVAGQEFGTAPADVSDGGDFANDGILVVFDGRQLPRPLSFTAARSRARRRRWACG